MPIVGFNFDKITVERTKPILKGVQIKKSLAIKDVEKNELLMGKKKDEVIKFSFEFSSKYEPKIGLIELKGHVLYMDSSAEVKKIMDSWKKNKVIPQDVMSLILNTILMRCNIKTLVYAQEVNLPPHIRLPTISPKSNVNDYIG